MKALVYLSLHRWLNSIKRIPKNPRLLLPLLFFAGLLLLQIVPIALAYQRVHEKGSGAHSAPLRHRQERAAPPSPSPTTSMLMNAALREGGPGAFILGMRALLLLGLFTSATGALGEGNLFFEASDIDFLFPAPFRRRSVLFIRMLARYGALLFPAVYLPIVLGGPTTALDAGRSPLGLWPGMLGAWLFQVAAANFAQAAIIARADREDVDGFANADRADRHRTRIRVVLGILLAVFLVGGAAYLLPLLVSDNAHGEHGLRTLLRIGNGRVATILLAPVAWAADLFRVAFEGWTLAAALRLTGVTLLTAASFLALFARERDFYDGAITVTARRLNARAAHRTGDTGALLSQMAQEGRLSRGHSLPTFGGGALALIWRNATTLTRAPLRSWINLLVLAALPALLTMLTGGRRTDIALLLWMVYFSLQMSSLFLVELRGKLRRADLSKSLPIPPLRFLLAELTVPALQLTILGYLSLTLLTLTGNGEGPLLGVAYAVFPTVAILLLLVQTGFVLLYPQQNDAAQQAIGSLMGLFVSTLAIAPAAIVGILLRVGGMPPAAIGAGAATVNLIAAASVLLLDAALWARFDPTD